MGNALSKLTSALLAIFLILFFPMMQTAQREEDLITLTAYNSLVQFTDAVRNKGYVTPEMYEDFIKELARSGKEYDIEMEHRHKKYHPEYSDPADPATFQHQFSVVYDAFYTGDVMQALYPESSDAVMEFERRKYLMESGDFWIVSLRARSRSTYEILTDFLYGASIGQLGGDKLAYGGMILNEDY